MPYEKTPLILLAALTLPSAGHALGLGEIHVDSPLNQPLDARIDIIGASADDLAGMAASVADPETFRRFGADRPAFLSSIVFKVTRDGRGLPVLAIRSTEAFSEPLVNILIDLHWHGGELIRQYSLLLDPAVTSSPIRVAAGLPIAGPPVIYAAGAATLTPTPVAIGEVAVARKTMKIGAKATLRGIAWRVGARSDTDLKRMMIAIFRANPSAFEGNINRLRLGAVLTIPLAGEVSAISAADAKREIRIQMESRRTHTKVTGAAKPAVPAVAAPSVALPASADAEAALNLRVETLEKKLGDMQAQLDREHDRLTVVQATMAEVANTAHVASNPPGEAKSGRTAGFMIAAAVALLAGAIGLLDAWRRRRALKPLASNSKAFQKVADSSVPAAPAEPGPQIAAPVEIHRDERFDARLRQVREEYRQSMVDASPRIGTIREPEACDDVDVQSLEASYVLEASGRSTEDTERLAGIDETATLPSAAERIPDDDTSADTMPVETVRSAAPAIDATKLDYNLMDLDVSVHHVQMPSMLHESVPFKERRTSLVDVLKTAVEREPNRKDLRMKLLETYYAAAAVNRQGFLDAAQRLARERGNMTDDEWNRIAWMGRQIAPSNDLFAPDPAQPEDEDLADCA